MNGLSKFINLIFQIKSKATNLTKMLSHCSTFFDDLPNPDLDINAQDFDGKTALMLATKGGHSECVQLLLQRPELDINVKDSLGDTAFIFACMKGHTDIVKLFIEEAAHRQVDFNAKGFEKNGYAWACRNKHTEIIQLLKSHSDHLDIDLNIKDKYGKTGEEYYNNVTTPVILENNFNPFSYGKANELKRKATVDKISTFHSSSAAGDRFIQGFL